MRIYIPAVPAELTAATVPERQSFAATPGLAAALGEDDVETLEFAAFLAAADASLELLASTTERRRVVISADWPARQVTASEAHPAAVVPGAALDWAAVAAIHIDEVELVPTVAAALAGDTTSIEALAEADLLWYAPSERSEMLARGAGPETGHR